VDISKLIPRSCRAADVFDPLVVALGRHASADVHVPDVVAELVELGGRARVLDRLAIFGNEVCDLPAHAGDDLVRLRRGSSRVP